MTREEALKLLPQARWYGDDATRGLFIDALVSLGLLKLDEPGDESGIGKRPWRIEAGDSTAYAVIVYDANDNAMLHMMAGVDWAQAIVNAANDELLSDARSSGNRPAHTPLVRHTYAEDLFRDALEKIAYTMEESGFEMKLSVIRQRSQETVYNFIQRILASAKP